MTEKDPFPGLGRPGFARRISEAPDVVNKVASETIQAGDAAALPPAAKVKAAKEALAKGRPGRPKKAVKDQPWLAAGKSKSAYYRDLQKGKQSHGK